MSYVYMKSLEKRAEKYDKGINILTFGYLPRIKEQIISKYLSHGDSILDIGMGTGTFLVSCALSKKNLKLNGIDKSEKMLAVAKQHITVANVANKIQIHHLSIVDLEKFFPPASFNKITAILSLSEMYQAEQIFCLHQIHRLLMPQGELIVVDETHPKNWWKKLVYFFIRTPLSIITFLQTKLSTHALKNFPQLLESTNFILLEEKKYIFDSLSLFRARKK